MTSKLSAFANNNPSGTVVLAISDESTVVPVADWDSEEEDITIQMMITCPPIKCTANINEKYMKYAEKLVNFFKNEIKDGSLYDMEPILVASGVDANILEELSRNIAGFHFRTIVKDGNLIILDLAPGLPHSTGVTNGIITEITKWKATHARDFYSITSDGLFTEEENERNGFAPDAVICVSPRFKRVDDYLKLGIIFYQEFILYNFNFRHFVLQ